MARNQGWRTVAALLLGLAGATAFWVYSPYLQREVGRQVEEAVKGQASRTGDAGGKPGMELKAAATQAPGLRYQVVTDGKQTFLADLKEGRVWRYFRHTREDGHLKDEEGFLPLPFFYGGNKYPRAGEVESSELGERRP